VDDRTHCATWDLLHALVGRPEFLYVADCKLASRDNLSHIATRGGRFVTVLPRTYQEDGVFRARLQQSASSVTWRHLYDVQDEQGELCDRFSVCTDEMVSSDGYRLLWFHSRRKADLDAVTRNRQIQRALVLLADLQSRLQGGPHGRGFASGLRWKKPVARILEEQEVTSWVVVRIEEHSQETYRQAGARTPDQEDPVRESNEAQLHAELGAGPCAAERGRTRRRGVFPC